MSVSRFMDVDGTAVVADAPPYLNTSEFDRTRRVFPKRTGCCISSGQRRVLYRTKMVVTSGDPALWLLGAADQSRGDISFEQSRTAQLVAKSGDSKAKGDGARREHR